MAKTYAWDEGQQRINISGGTDEDPVTFQNIVDYFEDNPMTGDWDMPRLWGSSPYELCENNASDWVGLNGVATPTNDGTDYTKNSYSIKAEINSIPSGESINSVYSTNDYIFVLISDTSSFALNDEVMITGTTNFNCVFRIQYIATNNYLRGYVPKGFVNKDTEYTGNVIKPLCLVWNDNLSQSFFGASLANKFKFSAKSDGASSPKIVATIIRSACGGGTTIGYGVHKKEDFNLTSSWQDFEFNIRDSSPYYWAKNAASARSYWMYVRKIYFFFDNLSIGDFIWLDGVRLTCTDRNPSSPGGNCYVFPTAIYVTDYFRDHGFNVRFDLLDTCARTQTMGVWFNSAALGRMELGDFSSTTATDKEGGVLFFNTFSREDTGSLRLTNVNLQGVTMMTPKDMYGGFSMSGGGNYFRSCIFINCLNFLSVSNLTFENCQWMGGRYFLAFGVNNVIDNCTIYGVSNNPFFFRWSSPTIEVKNVKIIDDTWGKYLIHADDYAITENKEIARFINFDIEQCNYPRFYSNSQYTEYGISTFFAFSFNLRVTDKDNNSLENVTVILKDKDSNQLFSVATDSNGNITEQTVDHLEGYSTSSTLFYFDTPTVDWIRHYPFTLTVAKEGYETYTKEFFNAYTRTLDIAKKGATWEISLKPAIVQMDQETL